MHHRSILPTLIVVASIVPNTIPASAQPDAGAKARGEFNFYGHSSHSHMNGAYHQAGHYVRYLSSTQIVSPRISTMTHTAIDHHLTETERHLDAMKASLDAEGDKAGLEAVARVNAHLADARTHHAALKALSTSESADTSKRKEAAMKLQSSLDKAIDEHEKLLHTLDVGSPPARPTK
jgi:hypothetical protein